MILCVALMFRYSLNMEAEAQRIENAVRTVLDSGIRTGDLGGKAAVVFCILLFVYPLLILFFLMMHPEISKEQTRVVCRRQ